jgi:subtilisin family serine protease
MQKRTQLFDELSSFSNYGNATIHVAAPGSFIYSTFPSTYSWETIWEDPYFSSGNLTLQGNWSQMSPEMPGELPCLHGVIPTGMKNTSLVIECNSSFITQITGPNLIWDTKGLILGKQRIEYSTDGYHWEILQDSNGGLKEMNWTQHFAPFDSIVQGNQMKFRVSWYITTDTGSIDFSIRNIRVGDRGSVSTPGYTYLNGTSMATPMVAGMAGLMKGMEPGLTAPEIKQIIMSSVDPLSFLNGKVVTGGRVNLDKALKSLQKSDAIPLQSGWNHVSVPRHLATGSDTAQIFAGVNSSGHSILMYQNETAGYRTLAASDLITPLQGYWLYSVAQMKVPVKFAEPVLGASRNISAGWSSVGDWTEQDLSANETFHTLMDGWSYAVGYDPITQQYEESIIRGGTGNQSDERPVHPYMGYWLYCSQNGTYQSGFG